MYCIDHFFWWKYNKQYICLADWFIYSFIISVSQNQKDIFYVKYLNISLMLLISLGLPEKLILVDTDLI